MTLPRYMHSHHRGHGHHRGLARRGVHVALTFLIGAALILWSWNTVATDLFAAPAMELRHAFAAEMLVATAIALPVLLFRTIAGRERHRGSAARHAG